MKMPALLGNLIVIVVLAVVVILAARSLWKSRKDRGLCASNCAACSRCHFGDHVKQ